MKLCTLCGLDSKAHLDSDGEFHFCEDYAVSLLVDSFAEALERQALTDELEARLRQAGEGG